MFPKLCRHAYLALTLQSIRMGAEQEGKQRTRLILGVWVLNANPRLGTALPCLSPLFLSFHSYYAILLDLELHTSFGQSKVFCLTRVFEPMTTKYHSHCLLITIISGYSNWSIMKGQSGVFKNNLDSLKLFSNGKYLSLPTVIGVLMDEKMKIIKKFGVFRCLLAY